MAFNEKELQEFEKTMISYSVVRPVVRPVSPSRIIVVLFEKKYAIPCQIKPGILNLTIGRSQSNFRVVFIFVSSEENGETAWF